MTDDPYRTLTDEDKKRIVFDRLRRMEAAHYALGLDYEDAVAFSDEDAAARLLEQLQAAGAQIARAQAKLEASDAEDEQKVAVGDVTIHNADGTVKVNLGRITPPLGARGLTRLSWRVWIAAKLSYHRARGRI